MPRNRPPWQAICDAGQPPGNPPDAPPHTPRPPTDAAGRAHAPTGSVSHYFLWTPEEDGRGRHVKWRRRILSITCQRRLTFESMFPGMKLSIRLEPDIRLPRRAWSLPESEAYGRDSTAWSRPLDTGRGSDFPKSRPTHGAGAADDSFAAWRDHSVDVRRRKFAAVMVMPQTHRRRTPRPCRHVAPSAAMVDEGGSVRTRRLQGEILRGELLAGVDALVFQRRAHRVQTADDVVLRNLEVVSTTYRGVKPSASVSLDAAREQVHLVSPRCGSWRQMRYVVLLPFSSAILGTSIVVDYVIDSWQRGSTAQHH